MSARAWSRRRNKPPAYLVHVDIRSEGALIHGFPPPATRVELARRRQGRLE